jgi:hypothetical protein
MNKSINILLGLSLLGVIISSISYVYVYRSLDANMIEVKKSESEVHASKLKLRELQEIELNLKKTVAYGNSISSVFLDQESIVDFIQVIEEIYSSLGLIGAVDSVIEEQSGESAVLGKGRLQIAVSAHGDWTKLVTLVGLLERLPYKSTINSVSLIYDKLSKEEGKTSGATKVWQLKINMTVWVNKKTSLSQPIKPNIGDNTPHKEIYDEEI